MSDDVEWAEVVTELRGLPHGAQLADMLAIYHRHGEDVFSPDEALLLKALITVTTSALRIQRMTR